MRMREVPGRRNARLRARIRLVSDISPSRREEAPTLVLDSSGTVLDSMRERHSLAYFPAFADAFFKGADRAALEEVWGFTALDSRFRSAPRFKLLAAAIRLAMRHPLVGPRYPREKEIAAALEQWIATSGKATVSGLEAAMLGRSSSDALISAAMWSIEVESRLAVLPKSRAFEGAKEALGQLALKARIVVFGEGRAADIERDWRRAGLLGRSGERIEPTFIGDEEGSIEQIALASGVREGVFVLVVGDSPADLDAARAAGAAFYPVLPGRERESWRRLSKTVLPAFLRGERTIADNAGFMSLFSSTPSWRRAQEGRRPLV